MSATDQILRQLSGIYSPSPEAALRQRPTLPIGDDRRRKSAQVPLAGATQDEVPIWTSESLDTKGYTLVNGYLHVSILTDTFADAPMRVNVLLDGSFNSPWAELARVAIAYVGPGDYVVPVLSNPDSLATQVRARINALDTQPQPPAVVRSITFRVEGLLAAGYRF